jgi:hypothetical protein
METLLVQAGKECKEKFGQRDKESGRAGRDEGNGKELGTRVYGR